MKKILSLVIVLCFSFSAFSQEKGFQLGLHFSPNIGWFKPSIEDVSAKGIKLGFSYGIIGDFNISDNYSFSTGISLLNMGGKLAYPDSLLNITNNNDSIYSSLKSSAVSAKYIQVPLTLKLKTNEIGYMKYYGLIGLGAGFNYGAKAKKEFENGNTVKDENFEDELKFFRVSLMVGLGAEYRLSGNTALTFGATFDNGFLNILKIESDKKLKAISNAIVLNIGVLF